VVNSKPAADIFVYAAGLLNVCVRDCQGIEDAAAGIEAIKNAGMRAVGIGPQERFQRADKVLPDLVNKRLQDLLDD
jgi:beta-phosphoglucomutase-like phosphatase (HAD superfamily)